MPIIPSREDIARFRHPVSDAVLKTVYLYEKFLQEDPTFGPADFYVQPYLSNHSPNLVIATLSGVLILEVFEELPDNDAARRRLALARDRANLHRTVFRDLCFPAMNQVCLTMGVRKPDAVAAAMVYSFVSAAVIVPVATTQDVRSASGRHVVPVYGSSDRAGCAPWPSIASAKGITDEQYQKLLERLLQVARAWLAPPYHRAEDGIVGQEQLTRTQRPHAMPRGSGWFRLQGPTGSGKSLVLAHKAAVLASSGKRVLVLCYNITLRSYLHDLIGQMRYDFDWRRITIRHFHELLKEVRLHFEEPITDDVSDKDAFLEKVYPELVERLLESHPSDRFRFDAILIDEGQDFSEAWFRVLAECLSPDGELLLVRDKAQNLYDKDTKWCEPGGPSIRTGRGVRGFSGPWANLSTAWRMSPQITRAVSEFAARLLGSNRFTADENRQATFFDGASFCRWENVRPEDVNTRLVEVVTEVSQKISPTHPSDLAVITTTNARAWQVVRTLEKAGLPAVHVYDSEGKRDRDKLFHFCRGDGRVKVCTGHSFKGFEVWGVIVLADAMRGSELPKWIYTAMGRAIEGVWVLNSDLTLASVEKWFPNAS